MTVRQYSRLVLSTQAYLLKLYSKDEGACWAIKWMKLSQLIAWAKRLGWNPTPMRQGKPEREG